jgi:hypothetical protein
MDDPDLSHLLDERHIGGLTQPPLEAIVGRHDRLRRARRYRAGGAATALALAGLALGVGLSLPATGGGRPLRAAVPTLGLRPIATRPAPSSGKAVEGSSTGSIASNFGAPKQTGPLCNGPTCGYGNDLVYRGTLIVLPAPNLDGERLRAELYPTSSGRAYPLRAAGWTALGGSSACGVGEILVVTLLSPGPTGTALGAVAVPSWAGSVGPVEVVATALLGAGKSRVELVVARSSPEVGEMSASWFLHGGAVRREAIPERGWTVLAVPARRAAAFVEVTARTSAGRALGRLVIPAGGALYGTSEACPPAG